MKRGRPPKGGCLVERAEGSDAALERARVIVELLSGELTVTEACGKLGIGETRLYRLRDRFIGEGVKGLEPKAGGRPAQVLTEDQARVKELECRVFQLEKELKAAEIRTRIAQVMPHLLKGGDEPVSKEKSRKHRRVKKKR